MSVKGNQCNVHIYRLSWANDSSVNKRANRMEFECECRGYTSAESVLNVTNKMGEQCTLAARTAEWRTTRRERVHAGAPIQMDTLCEEQPKTRCDFPNRIGGAAVYPSDCRCRCEDYTFFSCRTTWPECQNAVVAPKLFKWLQWE